VDDRARINRQSQNDQNRKTEFWIEGPLREGREHEMNERLNAKREVCQECFFKS
jgi:hypothetical protein